ncbi:MAG: hypothetical protein J5662_07050 [Clostridia bacterium]|nr:hypothetical protein [Clostridia bacterium]
MSKKAIVLIGIAVVVFLVTLGGCFGESEYEKSQNSFSNWSKKNPNSWSDSEKRVYKDFSNWLSKQ